MTKIHNQAQRFSMYKRVLFDQMYSQCLTMKNGGFHTSHHEKRVPGSVIRLSNLVRVYIMNCNGV